MQQMWERRHEELNGTRRYSHAGSASRFFYEIVNECRDFLSMYAFNMITNYMTYSTQLTASICPVPDRHGLLERNNTMLPDSFLPNRLELGSVDPLKRAKEEINYDEHQTSLHNILQLVPPRYSDAELAVYQITAPSFSSHNGTVRHYSTRFVVFLPTGYSFCTCLRERNKGITCPHQFAVYWTFPQRHQWHITQIHSQWIIADSRLNLRDRPWIHIAAAEAEYARIHPQSPENHRIEGEGHIEPLSPVHTRLLDSIRQDIRFPPSQKPHPPGSSPHPTLGPSFAPPPSIHPSLQPNRHTSALVSETWTAPPPSIHPSLQPNRPKGDALVASDPYAIATPPNPAYQLCQPDGLSSRNVGELMRNLDDVGTTKTVKFADAHIEHPFEWTPTPTQVSIHIRLGLTDRTRWSAPILHRPAPKLHKTLSIGCTLLPPLALPVCRLP
jgi:hypothetical protein